MYKGELLFYICIIYRHQHISGQSPNRALSAHTHETE